MKRFAVGCLLFLLLSNATPGKQVPSGCGTYPEQWKENHLLHRKALQARKSLSSRGIRPELALAVTTNRDYGNIAVIDDNGVLASVNAFDLLQKTVAFLPVTPSASAYRFEIRDGSYDPGLATTGTRLDNLGDDDTREVPIPFSFPYFGKVYQKLYVNSDGNLSFGYGDASTVDRTLGQMAAGQPRIAGLFTDLNPAKATQGVRVFTGPDKLVVSWADVPEYEDYGPGTPQSFQIRLYPDGHIEFAYAKVTVTDIVVGIAPGGLQGSMNILSFSDGSTQEFSSMVAEIFTQSPSLDIVTAAQKFYQTHEDSYDYLLIFNGMGIDAAPNAVAYEMTLRSNRRGIGDKSVDEAQLYGSPRRLQAITNMGPLSQYPTDPYGPVARRGPTGDTPVSVIGHEVGHLFLAMASVRNPFSPDARPMLGRQGVHWAFTFNSDASLLEGNRLLDQGDAVRPRFLTTATVQQYAPLDQYLMGLRASSEVPPTFLVENATVSPTDGPARGLAFDGTRRDIGIDEIIRVQGRRVPDYTIEQRTFRMAFVLVVHQGVDPRQDQLDKIESFRTEFEKFYQKASSGRATADTTLKKSLALSTFPSAGVVAGSTMTAAISANSILDRDLTVALSSSGLIQTPASVTIPAGQATGSFAVKGVQTGVDDLIATPADPAYETVFSKIQVNPLWNLSVRVFSGNRQKPGPQGTPLSDAVVFKVTDVNEAPYPGVKVKSSVVGGGVLDTYSAVSDSSGLVSFRWTPGAGPVNQLTVSLDAGQTATAVALGIPQIAAGAVVNAASFASGISPGALGTVYGSNLAAGFTDSAAPPYPASLDGVALLLDQNPLPLLYVSDTQINFYVPPDFPTGQSTLLIQNAGGASAPIKVPVMEVQPGIFFDANTGMGAILVNGTGQTTDVHPASGADVLEIYCTGLGQATQTTTVRIGNASAIVGYSGLAPGFVGLYQVNATVPAGLSGLTTLQLSIQGKASNEVKVRLQ